jgi:hypothetical protein
MRRILITGLILISGLGLFAQEKVEDVISKHITAIGGAENWKKVNTMVMEGTMNVMGQDVSLKISQVHNQGQRTNITIAGMENYVINTPTSGYNYYPIQGMQKPEPMTADDVKELLDDLDIQGVLLDYQAKGHKAELLGMEDIEGTECYKVKVTRKNSGEQTYFIDKSSYLIVRVSSKRKAMGQEMDVNIDCSDYKEVNGIKVPYSVGQGFGTMVVTSVKINEPVAPETFAGPK